MKKMNYTFSVPDNKRVRMIVSTDCKNEADDQFALAHHLMTPMFILKGIVPCHFNMFSRDYALRSLVARNPLTYPLLAILIFISSVVH